MKNDDLKALLVLLDKPSPFDRYYFLSKNKSQGIFFLIEHWKL
jgi:hypothetical protein